LGFAPLGLLIRGPELALQKGVLELSLHNERLAGGLVAVAVAWRWRLTFATIGSGLLALHLFDWLL
jgi:branched-subunit amino acid transport protein